MDVALTSFLIMINSSERRTENICFIYLLVFVEISVYDKCLPTRDRKKNPYCRFFSSHVYKFLLLMLYYTDNFLGAAVSKEH